MNDSILLEEKISVLNSRRSYTDLISTYPLIRAPNARSIKTGHLYACNEYKFDLNYPEDIIGYFDKLPLQLVVEVKPPYHFYAINLHFVYTLQRNFIINRLKNMFPQAFNKPTYDFNLNINYTLLKSIMRKSGNACRMYRFDRCENMRHVPFSEWNKISQFNPDAFQNMNITDVMKKMKNLG